MFQTHIMKFFQNCIRNKAIKKSLYLLINTYMYVAGNALFALSKKYASIHTRIDKNLKWRLSSSSPSHYNHEINLYNWIYDPSLVQFAEAGVLSRMLIKEDSEVLDLCCGDGLYTYLFLSDLAKSIDAIDIDDNNIANSIKKYSKNNINFISSDILKYTFKVKKYDVVVWSEAVAYFSKNERVLIYQKILNTLKDNGILYIRTPLERCQHNGANQISVIDDKQNFEDSFAPYFDIKFQNETQYKNRIYLNYYLAGKSE
jgi:2-polyprenyl-3-methyl-5-hydroxy-6-metoxy-1,4-benzoquinol methylase